LTRYTLSGERLDRQASTSAWFSILLNEIIPKSWSFEQLDQASEVGYNTQNITLNYQNDK
jgi:hypothetical protein